MQCGAAALVCMGLGLSCDEFKGTEDTRIRETILTTELPLPAVRGAIECLRSMRAASFF